MTTTTGTTWRKMMRSTTGLKITRNGDRAWTVTDRVSGVRSTGATRAKAVESANRLRFRAPKSDAR